MRYVLTLLCCLISFSGYAATYKVYCPGLSFVLEGELVARNDQLHQLILRSTIPLNDRKLINIPYDLCIWIAQ